MRLSISILGVVGLALTFASLYQPWLVTDFFDMTDGKTLPDFAVFLGTSTDLELFAYSTALYIVVAGLAVSIYSLLGGFITLAGASVFMLGGLLGEDSRWAFGYYELLGADVSPGIGIYVALTAALAMVVAIAHPLEMSFGKGAGRPKYRTWHVSFK